MCHSRTLLCLSTLILSLSSFTIADDAAVMTKLLAALSPTPSGWSGTDYCQWTNVNCSSDSRVTIIALVSQNLSGILPSNLGSLTELRSLSVQGNNFSGPLPSLAYLSSLEQLYLDNNYFSSIPDGFFQGLTSLKILFLSQNKKLAPWTFPTELTQSTSLVTLDAGSANLFGSLPDIFNVPNLTNLSLSFNNLTGPIPDLSKCIKLFDLQLRDNQFTGIVPDSLISLSSMKSISLSNNELQGPFPEFASNVDINDSDNSFCKNISGPCDPQVTILLEVAAALGYPIKLARFWKGNDACGDWSFITCNSQGKIISVNFGKQGFVGRISPAIANLTSLRNLSLNDNYLTDSIPDSLTTLPDLQLLDVSNNNLTGSIPKFTSTVKLISAPGNPLLGTSAGSQRLKAMIIALATLFVGIGVVIIMICCLRRKFSFNKIIYFWRRESLNYHTVQNFLRKHEPLAIKKYSHSDIKKMTNSFSDQLGEGGYGGVYKGKLQDGCLVAVKVLKELRGNGEEFINEVASISRTSHVNIVSLMGYCFESSIRALIYEFMPNGSLEKFIYKESPSMVTGRQLECMTLYKIALGIARGLEYLHKGCNTRIVHFDIKPHNILLDENFFPKISDFGLAQICSRENSIITMMGARGTMGYIAPEVCGRNVAGVSYKSDVYSYGMMVFEMVGGRRNIDVKIDRTSKIYFPHWIYKRFEQDEDLGLEAFMNEEDHETARKMIIVSLCCIQADPSSRPSMSEVVNMLEGSLESLPVPRNPFLSLPSRSPED